MVILVYIISVTLMIFLPVVFAAIFHRRYHVPWLLFCVGILTFAGSQAIHLPLNKWMNNIGFLPDTSTEMMAHLLKASIILGLSAGVCEELSRTVGYAILKKWRKDEHSIMLGLGHGGFESMIFGGVLTAATVSSLWNLRGSDLTALNLSSEQISAIEIQMGLFAGSAWVGLVPLLERLLAMTAHVIFSLLVFKAFQKKNGIYVLAAILYHALIDAGAVYLQYRWNNSWLSYGFFVIILIPGVIWALRSIDLPDLQNSEEKRYFSSELSLLWLAFKKEILQQWRSRRILVVGVVFLLFGLGSPLIAKYTPEILKSVEGAEMFADLIPEPGISDAMTQYIKNLTQFGFILAILLGMAAVVGEKERGNITMILSKPMPRWVLLLSKFLSQSFVYLMAFSVAGIGAYYYTVILFGAPDVGKFVLINLLLLVWLFTFVGVTLLASVLGSSTGAAAGIALFFSVILLISGNLPTIGALMPSGLTNWASSLGANIVSTTVTGVDPVTPVSNAGAIAAAGVLVLISLITALAIFERQEV